MRSSPVHRSGRPLNPADALRAPASPRGSAQVTHVPIQVGSPVFPARCPARGSRGFPASTHALELYARGAQLAPVDTKTARPAAADSRPRPRRAAPRTRPAPTRRLRGVRAAGRGAQRAGGSSFPAARAGRRRFLPAASRRLLPRSAGRRGGRREGTTGTRAGGAAARPAALVTRGAKFRRRHRAPALSGRVREGCDESDLGPPGEGERASKRGLGAAAGYKPDACRSQRSIQTTWRAIVLPLALFWAVFFTFPASADF